MRRRRKNIKNRLKDNLNLNQIIELVLTDVIFEDERLFFKKNLYRVISLRGRSPPSPPGSVLVLDAGPWLRFSIIGSNSRPVCQLQGSLEAKIIMRALQARRNFRSWVFRTSLWINSYWVRCESNKLSVGSNRTRYVFIHRDVLYFDFSVVYTKIINIFGSKFSLGKINKFSEK
jgi:hypothetical protein